jgi:hypothetical protein
MSKRKPIGRTAKINQTIQNKGLTHELVLQNFFHYKSAHQLSWSCQEWVSFDEMGNFFLKIFPKCGFESPCK